MITHRQIFQYRESVKGLSRLYGRNKIRFVRKLISKLVRVINVAHFVSLLPEILEPSEWLDEWYMKPFNGQTQRIRHLVRLSDSFSPTIAIETGTFYGTSTPFLSRLVSEKTYSIEQNERFYNFAVRRLYDQSDKIKIIKGNSIVEMPKILSTISPTKHRILAYLDAHWTENVPTNLELQALIEWGGPWIAVIDDFEVSIDSGFAFDSYGDQIVGLEMVPKLPGLEVWVSSVNSNLETGAVRGTGYIFGLETRNQLSELALVDLVQIN